MWRGFLPTVARFVGAILAAGLAVAVVAIVRLLPPAPLDPAGLPWVVAAGGAALVLVAATATLSWIVAALRTGDLPAALAAGASAALLGAGVLLTVGMALPGLPILGASGFILAAALADRLASAEVGGSGRRLALVATVLVLAEGLAAATLLTDGAALLLRAAAGIAALAALVAIGRGLVPDALALAVGAGGLGFARPGTLDEAVAVALVIIAGGLLTRRAFDRRDLVPSVVEDERLPDLAGRLADAVLRFDGRLRLADWNATAATLLDLDDASRGARMEDLLGVPISSLPAHDRIDTVERGVGGLDITIHRSGAGVTTIIRDPGRAPESERLSRELRGTIEELVQARRTIELQRVELERAATTDALTGLPSRPAVLERLRTEVAEAGRYRHPVAIVLVDVDGFGLVNRQLGTALGDAVLAEVALRLRLRVRTADAIGRLAGDCFLAILPHTDEAGAASFADALRRRLAARPVVVGRAEVSLTVSAGVAAMRAGDAIDVETLLARAEEALTAARTGGGDRIALDRQHGPARIDPRASADPLADSSETGGT